MAKENLDFLKWDTREILNDIKTAYKKESGKELEIGSNDMAIAAAVAYVCGCAKDRFNALAKQRFLSTATGEYLTALGETLGAPRPTEMVHATVCVYIKAQTPWHTQSPVITPGAFFAEFNGVRFTPMENVSISDNVTIDEVEHKSKNTVFIGVGDSASNENGIPEGAKFEAIVDGVKLTFETTTQSGGAIWFDDDETYRDYVRDNMVTHANNGSKSAYESRAKWCDARISSVYCLYERSDEFHPGVADVRFALKREFDDYRCVPSVRGRILEAITATGWKPLTDSCVCSKADCIGILIDDARFVIDERTNIRDAETRIRNVLEEYAAILMENIGMPFDSHVLESMIMEPDKNGLVIKSASVKARIVGDQINTFSYIPGNPAKVFELASGQFTPVISLENSEMAAG